jgi:hypothetical protein
MKFKEKLTLLVDQNPNGSYEKDVEGTLLVGDTVHSWDGDFGYYGHHNYDIYPAYYNGEKAFLKAWTWCPAAGYSANGDGEEIVTFEDGIKTLIKRGAYGWMFKRN